MRKLELSGSLILGALLLLLLLHGEGPPPQDQEYRLAQLSGSQTFDFLTWELEALSKKIAYGLLAPQRFMDDAEQAQFVLTYLENVAEARRLDDEINRAYTDPQTANPEQTTSAPQAALRALRARMEEQAPLAEALLGEQVSQVLNAGGFGALRQILPPVSGSFTPLPQILIISPRDHIETIYQRELQAGLTAAQQEALEQQLEVALPDLSAYVTKIGGLSAYPAMLLEQSSIDWTANVMAHEWAHHYLMGAPLGWEYMESPEARTINETTASLMGEWAGQEIVRRFYAPLLDREKALPNPLVRETPAAEAAEPQFDYRAEMHATRVHVDQLLAQEQIAAAEAYMETRRRYFVENGYRLRRLNQAYFAFHGAYASQPGASGADPLGPAVRRLWARSATPQAFVREIGDLTSLTALQSALE